MLHAARASHREQAHNRDFTLSAAASEADLAPLHGATQRSSGDVIGRLNAFVAQEGEAFFEVLQQRDSGRPARTTSSPGEWILRSVARV
jgi:hypothetical protein